ncbi:exportin-T-like isoform X3 [Musa acuminata AAA Group]|uniref:exportin-T-like isoform X3 n=1 Tax=Musa acuminata AAA Group TaxID=214697 RepID=UPI0031D68C4D
MDDLEKAILLVYEPGAADLALRAQAMAFCDRAKADPSALLRLCLDRLNRSPLVPVHFWCLQALHDAILLCYPSIPPADLHLLRSALLSLASDRPLPPAYPPFLRNKLAQALAALIRHEYPSVWPDPFLRTLPCVPSADPASVDMFARLLVALDDDLLSHDYPRSPEESADATRVKDAMRLQCVPQIARHWFDAASFYRSSNPSLATAALDTMRRYVTWIDIALIANEAFVPLLFDLILAPSSTEQLRAAAGGCVLAIAQKRMDPRQKVALLRTLPINRVFSDPELVLKVPDLVTGYAAEALECYKKLGSAEIDGSSPLELLEEVLPSVFYVMQESEEVELGNVVDFLSDYVTTMKSPSQKQAMYLGRILQVIREQICYDPAYRSNLDIPDKIGREEEDQMAEHRKGLLMLFCSVCRVAPDVTQLFIQTLLISALSSSEASVEEAEATLTLFYRLGETVNEEAARTGSGSLHELVDMLLSSRFPCHSHRMVALIYLETVTRFMKFVQDNPQYVPHVLSVFLDERGIHHPNLNVSRRASYLFMRAVKLLKAKFVPYLDMILQGLQDIVAQFTSSDWSSKDLKCPGSEDGSQTFEAIGLLIGMEDVPLEKQSEYLAAFLNPLCEKLSGLLLDAKAQGLEESSAKVLTIQQVIMALHALSKTLDVVLEILISFPNIKMLRNKITSFVHRMVDILGASIFPYLPVALKQLLVESEPKDMVDFLVLVNQLIYKFGTSIEAILVEIFPAIASRLIVILPKDAFPSGPGCNTEEVRELQELQKTLYTFVHVMANHDLSSVFIAPDCMGYLDAMMQLLLLTACSHKDILLRKLCVQIFVKLIRDWCTNCNGDDKVPGFRSFVIEKFATNCCLYSVLDKSFEFRDANTLVLFGEIVLAQKVMYEKLGNDFIIHFVSQGLQAAHCPHEIAEQYYQKLQQANDAKALRSFYQLLIENLRQQQNGSLVFREVLPMYIIIETSLKMRRCILWQQHSSKKEREKGSAWFY